MEYDIAVLGGGPAGYCAALKGAQLGANVVLFEQKRLGGVCLNVGCIPTKCYVSQAELMERIAKNMRDGIFKEAGLFSFKKIFEQKEKVVRQLTNGVDSLLKAAGVTVVEGGAQVADTYTIEVNGEKYHAKNMILATGSENLVPPIPGIGGRNVVDSTGLLAMDRLPQSLAIVGAGVIGLEFACAMNAFGCNVTAIDILPAILPDEDADATRKLYDSMRKSGVRFELGTKVVAVEDAGSQKKVLMERDGQSLAVEADCVMVCVGRRPNNAQAKQLDLELDEKGFLKVDEHMRTSAEHVYAAGDVTGGYLLAHSAYEEAEAAASNCMGKNRIADESVMPRCIFTLPSYAAVGATEQNAACAVKTGVFPFSANGRALASGSTEGFVKWIAEKETGKLIGCAILGNEAAELIHTAVVAVNMRARAKDFEKMIFPHPTIGECVKEAVLDVDGLALHLPLRRT